MKRFPCLRTHGFHRPDSRFPLRRNGGVFTPEKSEEPGTGQGEQARRLEETYECYSPAGGGDRERRDDLQQERIKIRDILRHAKNIPEEIQEVIICADHMNQDQEHTHRCLRADS